MIFSCGRQGGQRRILGPGHISQRLGHIAQWLGNIAQCQGQIAQCQGQIGQCLDSCLIYNSNRNLEKS